MKCCSPVPAARGLAEEHRDGRIARRSAFRAYFEVHFYLRIAELYDTNYTTLLAAFGSEVCVRLLCLDAAPFLDASMALGRASILFSATLSPAEYFIQTLGGGPAAKAIRLQSPFSQERLCLAAAGISTKYTDRERTRESVCRLIGAAVSAHAGNYIVFLPSYKYMQDVSDEFAMMYPDVPLTVQENGMDEDAREAFLAQFSADRPGTLVGFCVLGGIFAEGIDLAGDRLIGSIIVGVGLPQIGVEQNALRDYYEDTMGMGFEYAYQYPGMEWRPSAAGRVSPYGNRPRGFVPAIDSYQLGMVKPVVPPPCTGLIWRDRQSGTALCTAAWAEPPSARRQPARARF